MDRWKIVFICFKIINCARSVLISLVAKMVQEQYLKNCPAPIFMYFIILKWSFSLHNHKVYR